MFRKESSELQMDFSILESKVSINSERRKWISSIQSPFC